MSGATVLLMFAVACSGDGLAGTTPHQTSADPADDPPKTVIECELTHSETSFVGGAPFAHGLAPDDPLPPEAQRLIAEETLFGDLTFTISRIGEADVFLTSNELYPPEPGWRDFEVTLGKFIAEGPAPFWAVTEVGFQKGCAERQLDS